MAINKKNSTKKNDSRKIISRSELTHLRGNIGSFGYYETEKGSVANISICIKNYGDKDAWMRLALWHESADKAAAANKKADYVGRPVSIWGYVEISQNKVGDKVYTNYDIKLGAIEDIPDGEKSLTIGKARHYSIDFGDDTEETATKKPAATKTTKKSSTKKPAVNKSDLTDDDEVPWD